MTTYVAFLRAINLGAKRKFPKEAIRAAVEAAGMTEVETYINTGNVRFASTLRARAPDRGGAREGVPGRPRLRGAHDRVHARRAAVGRNAFSSAASIRARARSVVEKRTLPVLM